MNLRRLNHAFLVFALCVQPTHANDKDSAQHSKSRSEFKSNAAQASGQSESKSGASKIVAKNLTFPYQLAPDLKVLSVQFGAFPEGKGPKEKKGKEIVFIPTENTDKVGFTYGWKIKVDTPRKSVHVYPIWQDHFNEQKLQKGDEYEVVDGCIYKDWDEAMGTKPGKRSVTICVEGVPVKKLDYSVH